MLYRGNYVSLSGSPFITSWWPISLMADDKEHSSLRNQLKSSFPRLNPEFPFFGGHQSCPISADQERTSNESSVLSPRFARRFFSPAGPRATSRPSDSRGRAPGEAEAQGPEAQGGARPGSSQGGTSSGWCHLPFRFWLGDSVPLK